jgi:excisionase family DNA binding protein
MDISSPQAPRWVVVPAPRAPRVPRGSGVPASKRGRGRARPTNGVHVGGSPRERGVRGRAIAEPAVSDIPKLLLSVEEVAAALGASRTTVFALLRRRDIVSFMIGRYRRVPVAALEAYVARRSAEAGLRLSEPRPEPGPELGSGPGSDVADVTDAESIADAAPLAIVPSRSPRAPRPPRSLRSPRSSPFLSREGR